MMAEAKKEVGSNCKENKERIKGKKYEVDTTLVVGKPLTGYKKGRPLPVLPRMGRPPSSAPQNQTSTSTWNSTSYT